VLLFDPAGRFLLIRFVVPRDGGEWTFWALPGGEIEPGETEAEAAARELREELGIDVALSGPFATEANQFLHQGEMQDNTDFFFAGRCAAKAPRLAGITPEEILMLREARWWTREELAATAEAVFPQYLSGYVAEQVGAHAPPLVQPQEAAK
jgi:8-oxo-dGTP pyrophosphatase MutT (NUDIX family)